MTQSPTPAANDTGDTLPKRTTPTWEMEILLSGATVFALFQAYAELNVAVFWLIERLPADLRGLISPVGLYVQGGMLGLALGFLAHLILRAVWVSMVGLRSVDPEGRLRHNENLGPAQRALLGEALDALPQRIAALDDAATLVFGAAIGIAKMMAALTLTVGGLFVLAYAITAALRIPEHVAAVCFGLMALWLVPLMVATLADNQAGKHGRVPRPWVTRLIRLYAGAGYTADGNLGTTMATYRVAGAKRGWRAQVAIGLIVSAVVSVALVAPIVQYQGIGELLDGDFPSLRAGSAETLRITHYADRHRPGQAYNAPYLPSDVITGPYAELHVPYVPEWHDAVLARCTPKGSSDWREDPAASRAVLDCVAATQAIRLDGRPVDAPWWWSEDARHDRQGFQVMIDVRALRPGSFLLEIDQPEAERRLDDNATGDDDLPWRIPFWR